MCSPIRLYIYNRRALTVVVEYTLRGEIRPIGVATYNQYASLDEVPQRIAKYLPSPDEIERRLIGADE